jgi:hypothetical protein
MPIIKFTKGGRSVESAFFTQYPDMFASEKEKQSDTYIKDTLDYFRNIAFKQYDAKRNKVDRNYEVLKGILKPEDLYEEVESEFFEDFPVLNELPNYVKHYTIMAPIVNTLMGEMAKRPDNVMVKAFDDDSKSEQMEFKTDMLQQYMMQMARQQIVAKAAMQGIKIEDEDQLNQMTQEKLEEQLDSYTSLAERWGSRMMEYLKQKFNMKEKSEDAFRDCIVTAKEFFHIFEDKSPEGFNIEVVSDKYVWYLMTDNEKYISDPYDYSKGAYAGGIIKVMEMSEILQKYDLTKEEVDHMRTFSQQQFGLPWKESNVFSNETGVNTIDYQVYDPLVLRTRQMLESQALEDQHKQLTDEYLGIANSVATFGTKYLVIVSYFSAKKKLGQLTYMDENDELQVVIVDENYKSGEHPGQVDLEWGYINQWYQGLQIGNDIYYLKPLDILDYCPIIGSVFEGKNTEIRSYVDMMKSFQALYDIFMNKTYESLKKDKGNVLITDLRTIPTPKDGDPQDALDLAEAIMEKRGILYTDNSPENMQGPANFNQHSVLPLSRVQEMQGYFQMAQAVKLECWELMGMSRQRMGSLTATETATATNAALSQSYAQTEPIFTHHEYTLNKVYQAMLDAAMYIQSNKPESTISYISNEGEQLWLKINGSELKLRQLGVFATSRGKDARNLEQMRQMMVQALSQNGAIYEASMLFTTDSQREIRAAMKRLKEKQDQMQQQQQQMQQQELEQKQQQFQQAQQIAVQQHLADQQFEANQKELDRLSKERIAIIAATGFGKVGAEDVNQNMVPDVMEASKISIQQQQASQAAIQAQQKNALEMQKMLADNDHKRKQLEQDKEKLKVEREKIAAQVQIAKTNKNRYD